jgi:hypothetical protein
MQTTDIPIALECWMLKHGVLSADDMRAMYGSQSDIAWPEPTRDTMVSQGWKPSFDGEEPPF